MNKRMTVENGRLIYSNGKDMGAVYQEVDGYYVYWPKENLSGCWESGVLREIADILDEMNATWDNEVRAFFEHMDKDET